MGCEPTKRGHTLEFAACSSPRGRARPGPVRPRLSCLSRKLPALCPSSAPVVSVRPDSSHTRILFLLLMFLKSRQGGSWGAQSVRCLPSARVMPPGAWDRVPLRTPCSAGSLPLPLPQLPLLVCLLSLSHALSDKENL